MARTYQHLRVNDLTRAVVIEFAERKILEELSIVEIGEELTKVAAALPGRILILSFASVDHLSSATLGMLIKLREQVSHQASQLILADIKPAIYEVFKITKLNRLFEICDTIGEALDKVGKQA
jgi:anti-sigma B factor antagonist